MRRSLVHRERLALLNGLLDMSGRRARRVPGRPVELTVVVYADVHAGQVLPLSHFMVEQIEHLREPEG